MDYLRSVHVFVLLNCWIKTYTFYFVHFFSVLRMYNKFLTHQYVSSDNTISLQVNYKTLPQYSCFFHPFVPCAIVFYNLHVLNSIIHCNFYLLHRVNFPSKSFTIREKKPLFTIFGTLFLCTNFYFPIYFLSQEINLL